jgi:hypothetical protein
MRAERRSFTFCSFNVKLARMDPQSMKGTNPIWSEAPNLATEKNTGGGAFGRETRSLRFGYARAQRPRPRGIAEISRTVPECEREVYTPADQMAERVGFELTVLFGESGANAKSPDLADEKFELAVRISKFLPLARANQKRIRTAQLAHRENRGLRRPFRVELAVSGSVPRRVDAQHPAESRSFLGLSPSACGKSLQQQTEWRSK